LSILLSRHHHQQQLRRLLFEVSLQSKKKFKKSQRNRCIKIIFLKTYLIIFSPARSNQLTTEEEVSPIPSTTPVSVHPNAVHNWTEGEIQAVIEALAERDRRQKNESSSSTSQIEPPQASFWSPSMPSSSSQSKSHSPEGETPASVTHEGVVSLRDSPIQQHSKKQRLNQRATERKFNRNFLNDFSSSLLAKEGDVALVDLKISKPLIHYIFYNNKK
jgi:hypothetical protein